RAAGGLKPGQRPWRRPVGRVDQGKVGQRWGLGRSEMGKGGTTGVSGQTANLPLVATVDVIEVGAGLRGDGPLFCLQTLRLGVDSRACCSVGFEPSRWWWNARCAGRRSQVHHRLPGDRERAGTGEANEEWQS